MWNLFYWALAYVVIFLLCLLSFKLYKFVIGFILFLVALIHPPLTVPYKFIIVCQMAAHEVMI